MAVCESLGSADGSFFFTDSGPEGRNGQSLANKSLLLCGREADVLFCLLLPVESTNASIRLAIRYATIINLAAWFVTLFLAYGLSQVITRRHRRLRLVAARIADLDFSQRCPPAITTETDELGQIINSMADSLQENTAALREANERLQAELAERTRQQQITADLIANLSHDLKTPIAIISGYAEGLQEGVARTPEKQQTYYEMILRESERMQAIVSRLLALGRMESGETPIRPETFDLVRLLDELLGSFQREIERRKIDLRRPDWPGTCMVRTDYACARQSLQNYFQNAVYHLNGGSRIQVRLEDRGDTVRVRVTNSSAPIPETEAARLWEKLYRGDPSRQRQHGEMGLGLAIVKGNMERLGHAYGFENDPDFPGVCFWLELPKAPAEAV
jgi:signal transduction histidine kinase